jgi:hypothetical protein
MTQYIVGGLIGILVAVGLIIFFNPFTGEQEYACVCQSIGGDKVWVKWPPGDPDPEFCPPRGYNGPPCL